jgi:predicted membrane channel-forming protein YqfA (hemolysin III family)
VSWHTSTASGTDQYLDPLPWLVAGIVLVVLGVAFFVWRERRGP